MLGDHILARTVGPTPQDPPSWWDLVVTTDAVPHGTTAAGWTEYDVVVARRSIINFPPTDTKEVFMEFLRYNPTPISAGEVGDILTEELKIPRIEPTEVTEEIDQVPRPHRGRGP